MSECDRNVASITPDRQAPFSHPVHPVRWYSSQRGARYPALAVINEQKADPISAYSRTQPAWASSTVPFSPRYFFPDEGGISSMWKIVKRGAMAPMASMVRPSLPLFLKLDATVSAR